MTRDVTPLIRDTLLKRPGLTVIMDTAQLGFLLHRVLKTSSVAFDQFVVTEVDWRARSWQKFYLEYFREISLWTTIMSVKISRLGHGSALRVLSADLMRNLRHYLQPKDDEIRIDYY